MDANEIRAEVIDRLARMQFVLDEPTAGEQYEDWAPQYRREVTKFVDALGNMLPTEVRWKAFGRGGDQPGWFPSKEAAAESWDRVEDRLIREDPTWQRERPSFKRQYVTDWQDVTE